MEYYISLEVAQYISRAFPDLAYRSYQHFAEYCYAWLTNEVSTLSVEELAQECTIPEGKEFLLGVYQDFLGKTDAKVVNGELSCSDVNVYECLLAIYHWMDL